MQTKTIWKPLVAVSAALLAVVSLSSCSSKPSGSGGGTAKLVVYSADPANAKTYQSVMDAWGAQHNATIQLVSYPSASFMQSFTPVVSAKSQIDMLIANGQDVRTLASNGIISDITGVVDSSSMLPTAFSPFQINSKQYAVGFGVASMGAVVYNKTIFSKYGLTVPQTLADLKSDVAKLQGTGIGLFSVPGGNQYLWPMWMMQAIQQTSNNQPDETTFNTLQTNSPAFTSSVYVQAFQALADLGSANVFANGWSGLSENQAVSLMTQGKAAMFYGGTWDISTIVSQGGSGLDLGVTPFPSLIANAPASQPVGGVAIALAMSSTTKNAALVKQLVQYMTTVSVCNKINSGSGSSGIGVPVTVGATSTSTSPVQTAIMGSGNPTWFTYLDWYWPPAVATAYQKEIPLVISGKTTPTAATQAVDAAFTQAKQSGWKFG